MTPESMQETVEKTEGEELFDLHGENAKAIIKVAKQYKRVQGVRIGALADEKKFKTKIIELVRQANLQPVDSTGRIKFTIDGMEIIIQPRDEKVTVKEQED